MHAPQITLLALMVLSIGLTWAKHGEPHDKPRNVWASITGAGITAAILWWGGFWS